MITRRKPKPILAIASSTFGEAVRKKILLVILLIGSLFLVITPSLGMLSARQEQSVLLGITLGIIQLTSAVIALVLTTGLINSEIERKTIYILLSKPVQRWQFLIGKYLGSVLTLGLMMLMMAAILLVLMITQKGITEPAKLLVIAKVPCMYFFQMSLLAALAIFFSTFVSNIVNYFLSGGLYLVGSLLNPMFETIANHSHSHGTAKTTAGLIHSILPNFANFNIQNPIINPGQQIQNETVYFVSTISYGVLYSCILIILGMLIFDRREL